VIFYDFVIMLFHSVTLTAIVRIALVWYKLCCNEKAGENGRAWVDYMGFYI